MTATQMQGKNPAGDDVAAQFNEEGRLLIAQDPDKSDWLSEAVTGRTRDPSKDVETVYGDGTRETFYFTASGEYAGKSARA